MPHARRCKRCTCRRTSEQRRADPASRLAARLRVAEKRRGGVVMLRLDQIRKLLAAEDPKYLEENLVTLVRIRPSEPLGVDNVAIRRLGTIVSPL